MYASASRFGALSNGCTQSLTTEDPHHRAKLLFSFATIYLVWGSTYLTTKLGVAELPPFLFGAVRFITGGLLLYALAWWLAARKERARPRPLAQDWRNLALVGSLAVLVSNGGNIWGLQYVPSNQAALLNVSAAFWIPLFGLFGRRAQSVSLRVTAGLAIGSFGTVLVAWTDDVQATSTLHDLGPWPVLAVLLGCIGWSAATFYMRNVETGLDVMAFTGLQMLLGGLMMLVPALILGEPARWQWSPVGMASLIYMTLFSSCLAYTAYAWLSVHVTPAQVGTYGFVNPVIAVLLGWWVLNEALSPMQMIGTAIIFAAMFWINWPDSAQSVAAAVERQNPEDR